MLHAAGLPAGTPCGDGLDGAVVARRANRSYDARNRLTTQKQGRNNLR